MLDMYVFLVMPCGPKIKFENNENLLARSFKNLRKIFQFICHLGANVTLLYMSLKLIMHHFFCIS
jgi:hypothetical protein